MANNVKTDRFGNPYLVKGMKENKNGYKYCYVELAGKLYKIEPTDNCNNEKYVGWCKVTQVKKQGKATM